MILITGGTGSIGSEILRLLSKAGISARALARNPQKGQKLPGITWLAGDLAKPETLSAAFAGAKTLFLLTGISEDMAYRETLWIQLAPCRCNSLTTSPRLARVASWRAVSLLETPFMFLPETILTSAPESIRN